MTQALSDPWLELLHALRKQTGIVPIPLSDAEKQSGMVAAFAAAVAPVGAEPAALPASQPTMRPTPHRPLAPVEARRALLGEIRRLVAEQIQPTSKERDQAEPRTIAEPVAAPATVQHAPSLPPGKRLAMQLAAYKKVGR